MQNLTSPRVAGLLSPFKGVKVPKYILYILIAMLAYFAGDQKLLQDVFAKFNINSQNHSQSTNQTNQSSKQTEDKIYFIQKVKVSHIVDGDTFDFFNEDGKKDTVRIIAVNTLEMKETDPTKLCFAKKQTQFTQNYLLGLEVYLYGDKTQGERDKYNRILAYVATSSQEALTNQSLFDKYFYNDYLVDTGNADIYRANPPAVLFYRFEEKRNKAKALSLGMWSNDCK